MNLPAIPPGGPCPPNTPLIEGGQGTPRIGSLFTGYGGLDLALLDPR